MVRLVRLLVVLDLFRGQFPGHDLTVQLLNAAGAFALGFLVRPVGGWLLGWYADRRGRKAALTLSVTLMCSGSLLIAVTPGYATLGVGAPLVLVLARLMQGLSVGGEYGTSATYLSEIAPSGRRGFYSSFQYVTLIVGQLLALAVLIALQQAVLSEQQLQEWGWRIPFVIGAACAAVGMLLRRGMDESEAFVAVAGQVTRSPLRTLLAHRREVLIVIGLTMGGTVSTRTRHTRRNSSSPRPGSVKRRRRRYLRRPSLSLHFFSLLSVCCRTSLAGVPFCWRSVFSVHWRRCP